MSGVEKKLNTAFTLRSNGKGEYTKYDLEFVKQWNSIAENLGEAYKTFSTMNDFTEILLNALVDYSKSMTVLDMLQANNRYTGFLSDCYIEALENVRTEYSSKVYYALNEIFNYALDYVADTVISESVKLVLNNYATSFNLAKLFYDSLGKVGLYDNSKDYIDYMIKMETYYSAKATYEEVFDVLAAKNKQGTLTSQDGSTLYNRYENARLAAKRVIDKLIAMLKTNYKYLKGIDRTTVYALQSDIENGECPFAK